MSWDPSPKARELAPTAFSAWDNLTAQASAALDPALIPLIQERIATLFEAPVPVRSGQAEIDPVLALSCAEAVEQFVIDVAGLTDAQRDAVFAALGPATYPFFQVVYAYDLDFRLNAAIRQLFGAAEKRPGSPAPRTASGGEVDLWPALDRFLTRVAALDELDPVTTELIRLRGARAHNCRICQSRRSVNAVNDGADEAMFDKVDFFESSDLGERYKVALRLTDALLWRPAAFPDGLVDQVRQSFSPLEAIEIVLDVVRNAANKVAVALQADQAVVASGVEYFSVAADGTLAYGLQAPLVG